MTDLPKLSICHYCQRELKVGAGRYRLLFKTNEVDCCPPCFDATRALPLHWPEEPAEEQADREMEKES